MTETANGVESASAQAYFRTLETVFIELRGAPLLLSPADWQIARGWYQEGVPLELAERTLREIFERRRQKGTADKVRGLRFCRKAVEAAWKAQQELQAPGTQEEVAPFDLPSRLSALVRALPEDLAERPTWERRILGLDGDAAVVEARLIELDRELLAAVEGALGPGEQAEVETRLAAGLHSLAKHLPSSELERARTRLREELVREKTALPVLSLFRAADSTNS